MLLAFDIGNTNITMGVFDNDKLIDIFRLRTGKDKTMDEYAVFIKNLIDGKKITGVIISSVVPYIMSDFVNAVKKVTNIDPIIVNCNINMNITINTQNPSELGADRIVDAVSAYKIYGGPIMVIDFGTATTYDIVNKKGEFIAGITSPGIRITAESLWQKTAKLPEIEIKKPSSILARNTVESMQAGIVYGYIGQVKYIIKEAKKELGYDFRVVATGGLGKILCEHIDFIEYDHDLTIKGLKYLYDMNK